MPNNLRNKTNLKFQLSFPIIINYKVNESIKNNLII